MTTGIVSHPACLLHDTGPGHPETPSRLEAILAALRAPEFRNLLWFEAPRVDPVILDAIHDREYVQNVFDGASRSVLWNLDPDTVVSPHSGEAARRAAGALCEAIDRIVAGEIENAFCAVRPPGHHAKRQASGGFCLFNNVAIGTAWARRRHGFRRILIVDFDVHHGDGTQSLFRDDAEALFVSIHQSPFDPWSGDVAEVGGHKNILNIPIPAKTAGPEFRRLLRQAVDERVPDFEPEFILVSAGFDGHRNDPLGGIDLTVPDYEWLGDYLVSLARKFCNGRLAAVLEGGYDESSVGDCTAAFVRALSKQAEITATVALLSA
jgi:acetoin utilization deacetylase AcuC-like enzyme